MLTWATVFLIKNNLFIFLDAVFAYFLLDIYYGNSGLYHFFGS